MEDRKSEPEEQKQDAEKDNTAQQVSRDGFTAEEIGEAAAYDNETEVAQRLRRGDESAGDPDNRDVAGTASSGKVSPDVSADKQSVE